MESIMPSKSESQRRIMRAAAHSKEFADRVGIDQKVAKEFMEEDSKPENKKKHLPEHIIKKEVKK